VNLARKECGAAREDAKRALSLRDPDDLVPDLQVYYLLATVYARPGETELARTPRRRRSPRRCVIAWSEGCTASRGSRSLVPRPLSPFQTYIPS
jgi:hypothetical protein